MSVHATSGRHGPNDTPHPPASDAPVVTPPMGSIPGVPSRVADMTYQLLRQGRRYFGSAGAALTHLVSDASCESPFGASVTSKGLLGERATSLLVRSWMEKEAPNAVLCDSVHIRGHSESVDDHGNIDAGDTDHVLVMGHEVIIIDSKQWKDRMVYTVNAKGAVLRKRSTRVKRASSFPGGAVHAGGAKHMWGSYLISSAHVSSIVVLTSPHVFVVRDAHWKKAPFRLIRLCDLADYLSYRRSHMSHNNTTMIDASLVSQIATCCIKPYDVFAGNIDTVRAFQRL